MAHVISDECVSCGSCEAQCPVGAIAQGADHYEIDVQLELFLKANQRIRMRTRIQKGIACFDICNVFFS